MFLTIYHEFIFDVMYLVVTALELVVFINGIYRSITANNGRKSRAFYIGAIWSSNNRFASRIVSGINFTRESDRG